MGGGGGRFGCEVFDLVVLLLCKVVVVRMGCFVWVEG